MSSKNYTSAKTYLIYSAGTQGTQNLLYPILMEITESVVISQNPLYYIMQI